MVPRDQLLAPYDADAPPPVPISDIDCYRWTVTDHNFKDQQDIQDTWEHSESDHRTLPLPWTGETRFPRYLKEAPKGSAWVHDRLVKKIKTTRPPDIYPEFWTAMSQSTVARRRQSGTGSWRHWRPPACGAAPTKEAGQGVTLARVFPRGVKLCGVVLLLMLPVLPMPLLMLSLLMLLSTTTILMMMSATNCRSWECRRYRRLDTVTTARVTTTTATFMR